MKIKYVFADGMVSEVEVNDELGTIILDSRRNENTRDRKEERHCISFDALDYEGIEEADLLTPETLLDKEYESEKLYDALSQLTPLQIERLWKLSDGMSMREIAREEGTDHKSVLESINRARKKIKKIL